MKRFLARFIFAWKAAIAPDYCLDADKEDFWTLADAITLHGFLFRSDTGWKLNQILKNYILRSAVDAVNGVITNDEARAVARVVRLIDAHFTEIPKEEKTAEPEPTVQEMDFAQSLGV